MPNTTPPKAVIFGCHGTTLTDAEKKFFAQQNPVGFILFLRNCQSPAQVKGLTRQLREAVGRDDILILIDQEGGKVVRLKPPHWREVPVAAKFAALAEHDMEAAKKAVYLNARLIAHDLNELGINVNCAPLADIPAPGSHDVIGARAYGKTPEMVSMLASEMARGLLDGGVRHGGHRSVVGDTELGRNPW